MSVDKFGRRSNRRRPERGPKGEGFNLTPQGDYDIQYKRLQNLEDPVEGTDAVNFKTLQSGLFRCMQLSSDNESFDAQMKRIANASDPTEETELVTKQFVLRHIPEENKDNWSFKHKRLSNIASPLYDGEAVSLEFIRKNAILREHKSNFFDAKNTIITNLAPPSGSSDAINKGYLDRNALLLKNGQEWDFHDKRLINVKDPEGDAKDVVNFGFLNRYALCRLDTGLDAGAWDARGQRITYVGLPILDRDAVNMLFLRKTITDLSYEIYRQIMTAKKPDSLLYPYDKWWTEVFTTPWAELFDKKS